MTADPRRRVEQVFRAIDFVLIIFGLVELAWGRGKENHCLVRQLATCVRTCAKKTGQEKRAGGHIP